MNANKRPLMHYSDGGITADVELPELDASYTAERVVEVKPRVSGRRKA